MAKEYIELGKANREVVSEGVEVLRVAYEEFIHRKQVEGYDFKYVDGQMIGHNFYKLILFHIADESKSDKKMLLAVAVGTLQRVMDAPVSNENDPDLA